MSGAYGGLIIIIMYATGIGDLFPTTTFQLITQNNLDITTQSSDGILAQE